jgi:hypothetical protein
MVLAGVGKGVTPDGPLQSTGTERADRGVLEGWIEC